MEATLAGKVLQTTARIVGKGASGANGAPLLVGNRFRIGRPVGSGTRADALGPELAGLACFEASDNRSGTSDLIALRADPQTPLRAQIGEFIEVEHEGLITPLGYGGAGGDTWVVCTAPGGPSLGSLSTPWRGNGLLVHVLRPAAAALDKLQLCGLTHRAIRPDNVFPASGMGRVVLGPAWTGPPAGRQPCVFEPLSSAVCAPEARGQGTIADDIYALGVLLLALWTGEVPLAGHSPGEILQLKFEQGSHAALTSSYRLPRNFDTLLRAMLADEAAARPGPAAFSNLDTVQPRRGTARALSRATRPIMLGTRTVWNRRSLALEAAAEPALALAALRDGSIELWLRRNTDEALLAARLEELRHSDQAATADGADIRLMRMIALLDPLAPLFTQGAWLWPDGLGPILAACLAPDAHDSPRAIALLDALVLRGVSLEWEAMRPQQQPCPAPTVPQALLLPRPGDDPRSVLLRAAYWLNPTLQCEFPYPDMDSAASLVAWLQALEKAAAAGVFASPGKPGRKAGSGTRLLDASMHGFAQARLEKAAPAKDASVVTEADERLRDLAVLARSQRVTGASSLPGLGSVLLEAAEPLLRDWPGLARRAERTQLLRDAAGQGDLRGMLAVIHDPARLKQDETARTQAATLLAETRGRLAARAISLPARLEASRAVGRDVAGGAGLCCVAAALLLELLR